MRPLLADLARLEDKLLEREADLTFAEKNLRALGPLANPLAQPIGAPGNRISDFVRARRDISADTASRLGRIFDVDPRFWMILQAAYDLSPPRA